MYLLIIHDPCANSNNSVFLPLFPSHVPCLEVENLFRTSKTGFCDKRIKRNGFFFFFLRNNKKKKKKRIADRLAEASSISYSNDSEKKMLVQSHTDHTDQGFIFQPSAWMESILGICIISFTILESCIIARNNTCTKYMKLR